MECFVCDTNNRFDDLPPRERIAADPDWRVSHAVSTTLTGWLILSPRRHATSIADLTDAEAATLGPWLMRLSRALREVTGCTKTYVMQFAEREGFAHVHFHVVPRMPDLPEQHRGPAVFEFLGPSPAAVDEAGQDELAARLAEALHDRAR